MMKYNEWKLINESLGFSNIGLGRPHVIGGVVGAHYNEDEFGGDKKFGGDDDEDEEDDEDEDLSDDDGEEGDELDDADLGDKDDGSFPPDDSDSMGGDDAGDEGGFGSEDALGGDEAGDFGDELASAVGDSDPRAADDKGEDGNSDFLGDIDPALLGGDEGGSDGAPDDGGDISGADIGDGPAPEADGGEMGGEPCPDCNPDGSHEIGEPECDSCGGLGFLDDAGDDAGGLDGDLGQDLGDMATDDGMGGDVGDVDDGGIGDSHHQDTMDLVSRMAAYMGKYMTKESAQYQEAKGFFDSLKDVEKDIKKSDKKEKKGKGKADNFKKGKKEVKHCPCESTEFLDSLTAQSTGNHQKGKVHRHMSEDALLSAVDAPGQVGFAPNGKLNSIGGGYTMADFADMPTLGESTRYPTLNEWMARKAQQAKKKRK